MSKNKSLAPVRGSEDEKEEKLLCGRKNREDEEGDGVGGRLGFGSKARAVTVPAASTTTKKGQEIGPDAKIRIKDVPYKRREEEGGNAKTQRLRERDEAAILQPARKRSA